MRVILIMLVLAGISCSVAKERAVNLEVVSEIWTKKSTVQKAIEFERIISSEYEILEKNVLLSKSVFPLLNKYEISKPLIVKRKQTGFLPIYAEYFFSEQDSILRYISYDWERDRYGNFFDKQKMWKEESTKLNSYNQEYERIKSELEVKFGQPKKQDNEPQTEKSTSGGDDYLIRNTIWETDDFFAKFNMVFASTTYRLRLNYYWKK